MATASPSLETPDRFVAIRKYSKVFRVALAERMVYRADFMISTFLRFLPMLTTILLWYAIYRSAREETIATFRFNEMISYLLLVHISRMFSSMPGLARGIAQDIRDGSLKKYLLQPIDMISYLLTYRVAHKIAYITMSSIPYGILFFICRGFFPGLPDGPTWVAYVASLLMGFLIGFFFEATIGMIGFWFLEITSFLYVVMALTFFLSGHMFPLDLLGNAGEVLKLLPLNYLAYFPAAVFLGKIQGQALIQGLIWEFCWVVGLIVTARVVYRLGLRRYSAFGG